MRYEAILSLLLLLAAGCAERAWIRSAPPGANVYVNGHFIGITPVVYSVHRPEFNRPLRYRLECDGYGAVQGELQKRIGTPTPTMRSFKPRPCGIVASTSCA